jgi:hypothetical protein
VAIPIGLGVGLVALLVVGWLALGVSRPGTGPDGSPPAGSTAPSTRDPLEPLTIESIQRGPHLVFQNVVRGEDYAEVSLVRLDAPAGARLSTGLVCERVHFAGGAGLCLAGEHEEVSTYFAQVFDAAFQPGPPIALDGAPAFVRISPDGRYGAISVQTRPSTPEAPVAPLQTLLVDMATGRILADLRDFAVVRDGTTLEDPALDAWGVTFRDDGTFFASIRTAGNTYLVEGDVEGERMTVRASNVSAPALSPDGTRLAYAKLVSSIGPTWRFHVLDLATMEETALAETQSIDEQPEWLDDATVLYGLATDIWSVPADGSGQPQPFLFGGLSPAVVR